MENWKKYGFLQPEPYEFPTIVNINLFSGKCVCSCIHCPVGRTRPEDRGNMLRTAYMSMDVFRKAVDEISLHNGCVLRLHSVGEPLLWEHLPEAIQYAKKLGVKTWLFTSAALNNPGLYRLLCENTDIIEVSVNSTDRVDYRNTKGVDLYDLVCDNIDLMRGIILSEGLDTRLICSRVQTSDQEKDSQFTEYWKRVPGVADSFVRSYHDYNGILSDSPQTERKIQPCLVHWGRFNIDYNGNVAVCFNEFFRKELNRDYILGNITVESIETIWKSDRMNGIRMFLLGKSEFEPPLPCVTCTTCQKYPPHSMTSERQLAFISKGE